MIPANVYLFSVRTHACKSFTVQTFGVVVNGFFSRGKHRGFTQQQYLCKHLRTTCLLFIDEKRGMTIFVGLEKKATIQHVERVFKEQTDLQVRFFMYVYMCMYV